MKTSIVLSSPVIIAKILAVLAPPLILMPGINNITFGKTCAADWFIRNYILAY
jgi:hypothetical protein